MYIMRYYKEQMNIIFKFVYKFTISCNVGTFKIQDFTHFHIPHFYYIQNF